MAHAAFDHLRAARTHWWFVFASGMVTLVCGTIGGMLLEAHDAPVGASPQTRFLNAGYAALQMLVLHPPHEKNPNLWFEIGRISGAVTFLAASVLLLWKRVRHEFRELCHRSWSGHHVICGLGERGFAQACHLVKERRARVVVIDRKPDEEKMVECERLGMFVLVGNATKREVLRNARVSAAAEVWVMTESDETNVRVGLEVNALGAGGSESPQTCRVHLSDINLRDVLQRAARENTETGRTRVEFFDVFAEEAQRILVKQDVAGVRLAHPDPRGACVVILGFGRMGRSVALEAAKSCPQVNGQPVSILVVDRQGEAQRERFFFRHPELEGRMRFESAEAESATARKLILGCAEAGAKRLHVFVCVDENTRAAEIGLRLREDMASYAGCTLAVRIKSRDSLGTIFEVTATGAPTSGPKIEPFGMVESWTPAID